LRHTTSVRLVLFAALLSLGVACRESAAPPAARAAPPRISPDAPGAPFALGEVIRRTHFSYREQGDGWSAGHGTWSARVTAGGLTFTPRHALVATPESGAHSARQQDSSRVLTGAPITFGAAVVSRGGASLDGTAGRGSVSQDGSLSLARGEVKEQFLNSEDGVEQRWHFERQPRGEGAMLLRVPVQGLRYAGETSRGVHFADATGLGVRYSHATWRDAAGKQTEVRARAVAGAVEFQVPAALLASSAFPAMLGPTISPEFGLDTPVTDPGGGSQTAPAVASNGTDYLVVWTDDRGGDLDIYGARVSQAGVVLDSTGIPIARALNSQQNPAVAFDGTNYFVVWSDGRRGSGVDIYGARVSPAGSVLDATGRVVANSSVFTLVMDTPAIAFDGTNYLVVWEERLGFSTASNLMGTRVSPAGVQVGSAFIVSNATGNQSAPALAFDGTNYLAVWQDDRTSGQNDIYAARVSPAGNVLDVSGIAVGSTPESQLNPTVAFNGLSYLVVWEDYRNLATSADLYGARLTPAGTVQDPSGLPIVRTAANQSQPSLARVGSQYLLAWHDLRADNLDVYAARVDGAGSSLDGTGVPVKVAPGNQSSVAVAANGTGSLVTWNDGRTLDIAGARVSAAGAVLDVGGFTISLSPNSETNAAVAFDGTNFLVVWQDNRGNGFDIYGVRVSASGTVLDPSGLAISTATGHQRNPALAYDGTNYLVVWEDTRSSPTSDIYGARVSPSGAVLDPNGLGLCLRFSSQEQPAVAYDGTNYLVVWADSGTSNPRDIYGTRVSRAGAVLDPAFLEINANAADQAAPALAFDGSNYLVVWSDWRNNATSDIYGTRVTRAGAVLEANGTQIGGGPEAQADAAVAFDGTNYLVVWSDYQLFPSSNLFARRVRTAGAPLDLAAITVSAASGNQQQASVVYNGTDFTVAWQDSRSGTDLDIYGGRITRAGVPQDGDGFILSAGPNAESTVALASAGSQGVLAVYQVTDPSLGSNVQRLKARWLSNAGNTPPTAEPQSATTEEDQPLALELTGSDAEGGTLVYTIVNQPQHGTLSGPPPKVSYTPALNYHGPDSFTFTVSDGQATSAAATVSLTITPLNDAPTATAQTIPTPEETATDITLTAVDPEGEQLSFTVATQPTHGTLTGTPPNLTYTPALNYHGPDSFTFTASDGTATSAPGTITISVTPVNDAPVATPRSLSTPEGTPVAATLTGSDVDGDPLTFAVASQPAHGTLTGTPPNLTYTPAPSYNGPDSFTFTASDGTATSAPATLSITVTSLNDAPVATARSLSTPEDTQLPVTLTGSDADGDPLTFAVASQPAHGTLTGTPPNLTYTPALNYHGPDSFTFTASDGTATSAPATLSITVTPVNDAPVATARSLTTQEDRALPVTLTGSDVDGDPLTFAVASQPAHGTLTGTPPNLTYTPAPSYNGPDSFTFTASDGTATSAPATLSITVTSVNNAPVASPSSATTQEDTPVPVTLTGSDVDGDPLTFAVASQPAHGTLTGTLPNLTYTPALNYHGPDSFTFTASDGTATSARATVSLTITPVNDAPGPVAQSLTIREDTPRSITLTASDPEGDPVSFAVASGPSHGTLSGTPPALTYTPEPNYRGPDSFTFTASDGTATSAPATVSLTITEVNDAPTAQPQSLTVAAGNLSPIYLDGSDVDGEELTFSVVSYPETGRLTGTPPDLYFTAPPGLTGTTRFTFSASDGRSISSAEVQLTVVKRSLTVSAAVDSMRPADGQQVRFYANAVDEAGAPISLQWDFGDGQTSQEEFPAHAFAVPGTYEVKLKASTATEEATTSLRVRVRGSAPVLISSDATAASTVIGVEGSTLAFQIREPQSGWTYTWDFGDGTPAATGAAASHAWGDNGRFSLKVTASDASGTRWTATRAITIHNTPPVPLHQDRLTASVGQPVSVQLAGSDAAGAGDPLRWEMIGGNGSLTSDGTFTWTPTQEGLSTVITKVLDEDGGEARLAFQISTGGAEPEPEPDGGCGCGTSAGGASGALGFGLLLLGLVVSARRSRS
jgi:hypothetical protein